MESETRHDNLLEESQNLYEDFGILNDPIALEATLKSQYEKSKTLRSESQMTTKEVEVCDQQDSIISTDTVKEQPLNLEIQPSSQSITAEDKKKQVWSDMLSPGERQKAFNAGQSMDSKKVTEALGFLDMKQICYCLAQALMKHVEFGKGFFFLADLQKYLKHCEDL